MVRYVRTKLKKSAAPKGSTPDGSETPRGGKRGRADSLVRDGTGRYAQALGDDIATEKGLLKQEYFERVQRVIEVYSKALLTVQRKQHMQERQQAFAA